MAIHLVFTCVFFLTVSQLLGQERKVVRSVDLLYSVLQKEGVSVSKNYFVIKRQPLGDKNEVILSLGKWDGTTIELGNVETSRPDRLRVSTNQNLVAVNYEDPGSRRGVILVKEIGDTQTYLLEDRRGGLFFPEVSPKDNRILYQLRIPGTPPQVFLANYKNEGQQFISDGVGQMWLPDAKGYVIKSSGVNPGEALRHGTISRSEFEAQIRKRKSGAATPGATYTLFHEELNNPAVLPEIEDVNPHISFSPIKNRLAVMDNGELSVRSYSISDGRMTFQDKHVIDRSNSVYEISSDFAWAPDGDLMAYVRSFLDNKGHDYVNRDVFLYDCNSREVYNVYQTLSILENTPVWTHDGQLIITRRAISSERVEIVKLVF